MMACFGRSIASRTFLPLPAGPAATAGPPHGFDRSRTDAVATAIRPSLLKVTCDDRPTPLHSTLYSPRAGCLPATVKRVHDVDKRFVGPTQLSRSSSYISVLDHDADGSLWIKRVLLQGRVPVDGHCRPYAEFVVELRKRQDVNFILHVAHAGSVFDDRERRRLVRIGPGIASDGYNSILHAYLEVVEHNPVANAVVTKPIRDGFMQLLVRDRYYRFHRDEVAHTLDAVVLARQMLRFHLLA